MVFTHSKACLVLFAVCILSQGCGPKMVDISGKVTYNGEAPGEEGCHIVFAGPEGKPVDAKIEPSGEFKVSNVVAGANQIAVYYKNPKNRPQSERKDRRVMEPSAISPLAKIPHKYADVKSSGLTLTIDASGPVPDIPLEGPELK